MVDVKDLVEYWYSQGKIKKYKDRPRDIQICCPRPHYRYDDRTGQMISHYENRPSLGVNLETGVFNCLACGFKGRIETLNAEIMGMTLYESIKFLSDRYDFTSDGERVLSKEASKLKSYDDKLPKPVKMRKFSEAYLRPFGTECKYYRQRGYSEEILKKYHFGYDSVQNRAVFPVWDADGAIVGLIGRDVTNENPVKFLVYNYDAEAEVEGWDRGSVVHFSIPRRHNKVFVVESGQDVPWGDQLGLTEYMDIGSILGSKMTEEQAEILSQYEEVILALDNDYAGIVGTSRAVEMLKNRTKVTIAKYPYNRKDLGDCNREEVDEMFRCRESPLTSIVRKLSMISD